jgi:hypothetical protein
MTSPPPSSNTSSSALTRATPAPAPAPPVDISSGVFSGIAAFEAAQRMAQALCTSTMVPSEYRGQQGLSNSLIALEIAARMGLSPLVVMQNMTPIHGKPSWSSSFLIATVNASGRFTPLRFVFDDKDNPSSCYAVARDKATGEVLEGQRISVEMAKREGWWSRLDRYGKETSKWQSMTGQMLRYRAAAFWVKVYCPEISLGLMTQEEVADVQAVVVETLEPEAAAGGPAPAIPQPISRADSRSVATEPQQTVSDGESQASTADTAPAPKRSSRRTATAQKEPPSNPTTVSDGTPLPADPPAADSAATAGSPTGSATDAPAGPTDSSGMAQAELLTDPPPAPANATKQPSSADLLRTAQQEIPKLATAEALENARQRVNRLLAEGQLNDEGAERLWSLIDRRLQQLQVTAQQEGEP